VWNEMKEWRFRLRSDDRGCGTYILAELDCRVEGV
jgi:hypothetical protein